ncbi:hypothetical protein NliqN6_3377 [Naganishia liquefaciens]|uniref:Phosphatidic acid phosphatase type 2/haloperoxidase domain-containing protein n=1 Tax=Naganishia liquefaciens TaxID=104408 RepID=A0A8H3TTJ2_9TREE|nr:hypothetical protein NliqN6_3377 [Naganishia liquefaciens]
MTINWASSIPYSPSPRGYGTAICQASQTSFAPSFPGSHTTMPVAAEGDWFLVAALWVVLEMLNRIGGHKREFSLTDITIQRPFKAEHVPPTLLFIISLAIPLAFVIIIGGLVYKSRWDVHNAVLGLFMGFTVTGVVTQVVKMGVGRPRPDAIARCQPYEGAHDAAVYGLSNYTICTQENAHILNDGFKSFPSGHSSLSFAGMGFLAFYLAGKMHLADLKGHRTRAWLALSPLLASTMVAVSRTADNRHHWQDVTVGSLLGLGIAWVAYRAYFPSLATPQSHLPLAPPHYEDHGIPLERRDEEERIALSEEHGNEDEDDEDSVDSVVPRDYAR